LVQESDFWQPRIKIGRYFVHVRLLEELAHSLADLLDRDSFLLADGSQ
jgi:hypothetical protein